VISVVEAIKFLASISGTRKSSLNCFVATEKVPLCGRTYHNFQVECTVLKDIFVCCVQESKVVYL